MTVNMSMLKTLTAKKIAILTTCALAQSCTWVELSEGGKAVVTKTIDEVANCNQLANTTVNTMHKVGFFNRDDYKLRTELNDLARNEATKLGGNTLVAMTRPKQGAQTFAIYSCP